MENTAINYAGDFRSDALWTSMRFCEDANVAIESRDLTQSGASLCLPALENPTGEERVIRRMLILWHLSMLALLVCGGAMLFVAIKGPWLTPIGWLRLPVWLGTIPLLAGWVMMCSSVNAEHWIVRRRLVARGANQPPFTTREHPLMFRIEDLATYSTVKVLIEDVAIVWCDVDRRVFQLEGFAYRYVIWAKDILSLTRLGDRFVEVKFYVGQSHQCLALALAMNGAAIELKRQLTLGIKGRAVEAPLLRVIGLTIPWPNQTDVAESFDSDPLG